MTIESALRAFLKLVRVALAAVLLVGVPLADASACSLADAAPADVAMTAGQLSGGAGDSQHDSKSPMDAHCVHGHCHQQAAYDNAGNDVQPQLEASVSIALPEADILIGDAPMGLERPPKA